MKIMSESAKKKNKTDFGQRLLVVCWINNARNFLPGLAERGRVGHLPKMGDEPCVVESPKSFS